MVVNLPEGAIQIKIEDTGTSIMRDGFLMPDGSRYMINENGYPVKLPDKIIYNIPSIFFGIILFPTSIFFLICSLYNFLVTDNTNATGLYFLIGITCFAGSIALLGNYYKKI